MLDLPFVIVEEENSRRGGLDYDLIKFSNHRTCNGAVDVLQVVEGYPANVVTTKMNVGEMTHVELAEAIRDIDEERNNFTYITLIGAVNHERGQLHDFHQAIDAVNGTIRVSVMVHLALAAQPLNDAIRQAETRGGKVWSVMISVHNPEKLKETYAASIAR